VRHSTADPFAFIFSPFVKNRISIHHTMEIGELKQSRQNWKGLAASILESYSGRFGAKYTAAFVGVTNEIADYQKRVNRQPAKPAFVFPNGIALEEVRIAADLRQSDEVEAVFISSKFARWHGLDKLVDLALKEIGAHRPSITIHLVGELSAEQDLSISRSSSSAVRFVCHGSLTDTDFIIVFARCDFGFDALSIDSKGLGEASTLKVRELLAAGLPVFSSHKDAALPLDFPFYHTQSEFDLKDLVSFGLKMKKYARDEVRRMASKYISKESVMLKLLADIANSGLKKGS
jgi:glycosyltransferase involved in cell wall biosynthesis